MDIHFEIWNTFTSVTKLVVLLKSNFKWALDYGKGSLNCKNGGNVLLPIH